MVGREKPLALVHRRHTRHEVLLPLRHQFSILQREFLASAPGVRFLLLSVPMWAGNWRDSRNSGPCHQQCSYTSNEIDVPRDAISAGLHFVRTWHHWSGSVSRWISPIRLATNGLKIRLRFRIQNTKTTITWLPMWLSTDSILFYSKTSRLGRRKCQSTTRAPNNIIVFRKIYISVYMISAHVYCR